MSSRYPKTKGGEIMATTNRFFLRFHSTLEKVVNISIPRARDSKSQAATQDAMQAIINNGAVVVANIGSPLSIKEAKIITTSRAKI
jgi:hypothetical protein